MESINTEDFVRRHLMDVANGDTKLVDGIMEEIMKSPDGKAKIIDVEQLTEEEEEFCELFEADEEDIIFRR